MIHDLYLEFSNFLFGLSEVYFVSLNFFFFICGVNFWLDLFRFLLRITKLDNFFYKFFDKILLNLRIKFHF